ncbi:hypothetical protein ACQ4PT_045543 [Festuca glaucescens]
MATGSKTQESKLSPELPTELPYDFLKKITNDFSNDMKISGSPFGTLYKGIIPNDDRVIAVKKLQENAPMPADKTFTKEVTNVMALKHENIVQIVGYCSETSKKLVQFDSRYIQADINESLICYEYLPKGNLEDNLFGPQATSSAEPGINWDTRFKIIKGICKEYLAKNKLDCAPKEFVGSYGYMAPEYLYRGEISAQSDIYSLGLIIIEITTREKNRPDKDQPSARSFIDKVGKDWTDMHIADKYGSSNAEVLRQVKTCIDVGLKCVEIDRKKRPPIDKIVAALKGLHAIQIENEVRQ